MKINISWAPVRTPNLNQIKVVAFALGREVTFLFMRVSNNKYEVNNNIVVWLQTFVLSRHRNL